MVEAGSGTGDLLHALRSGSRVALGRAITLVESTRPADREAAAGLVRAALGIGNPSVRIGITGIPGVGKSTLIDALGMELIARGHRVAVLAIDPSSTRTGGSILGDKTRMERLAAEDRAFIRPSPSGGTLGGVARRTREAMILCEAAGYDRILIETVGVGQSETAVDQLTDLNLLLTIGGTGDSLQGIKRGIMESADLIALTKTDGGNEQRNERAAMDLKQAISLLPPRDSGERPPVKLCSATTGKGIPQLAEALEQIAARNRESGYVAERRQAQTRWWLHAAIQEALIEGFKGDARIRKALPEMEEQVARGEVSPFDAAEELLRMFRG
ncbi:MAG TPA: methylmalonyl Co-A mutase-associated GTPase MeaB [Flavobacteriales bacterium]|nr:methylmalonyl Co-A mutase-associated GTPase MeaB [Flavobacteriales bacterium]